MANKTLLVQTIPTADDAIHHPPPALALMALEFRVFAEFWTLLPAWPALRRAPAGDGHCVIIFPGLAAGDASTAPLRMYLTSLGYEVDGWNQGMNLGPRQGVLEAAKAQVTADFKKSGRKVSLIGWSLGGIYAREIAKMLPDMVHCVITLGTPFASTPKSTNLWRLYELATGRKVEHEAGKFNLAEAPPMPTASIYSKTDGVVAWQGSIQAPSKNNERTENIEVFASHIGLGVNPSTWWAVANRLSQTHKNWTPFVPPKLMGLQNVLYPQDK
mgnify:FL=1|jgi:pimeloyl-ACP methyl ester carboxylesterase